jgi:hypothetical protein
LHRPSCPKISKGRRQLLYARLRRAMEPLFSMLPAGRQSRARLYNRHFARDAVLNPARRRTYERSRDEDANASKNLQQCVSTTSGRHTLRRLILDRVPDARNSLGGCREMGRCSECGDDACQLWASLCR